MSERMLRNTAATVTLTFYTGETAADADAAVTYTVIKADGTTLSTGSASHTGAVGSGQYIVPITPQTNLNNLTVSATGTFSGQVITLVSSVEIVGGFYFPLAKLRAYDAALTTQRFSTAKLVEKRQQVETEFESICGQAFVPRFGRETGLAGYGVTQFWLDKPNVTAITKLVVDGVDMLAAWVTAGLITSQPYSGALSLSGDATALSYAEQVDIEYEYGMATPPFDIEMAALRRARGLLLSANATIDERATSMNIPEFGSFALSVPGQRGAHTGIPEVDAVLNRHMHSSQIGVW